MTSSPQKIVSALHANWCLNAVGLLLSYGASIVLVRAMPPELYAQYAAVIASIGIATLVFEAGANSGLTRYLTEAGQQGARGTFYRRMQHRRWLAALACGAVLMAFGPMYARATRFENLAGQPWLFVIIAAIVAGSLTRLLPHYGLLALFEAKTALLFQQGFLVVRSVVLALVALAGGTLLQLTAALLAITVLEALLVHDRFWRLVGAERAPVSSAFINRAQTFGLLTVYDKFCAMLGSGTMLLLVLAPSHPALAIASLALAVDLVGKLVSITVMPMGNLVAPYLSQTGDAPEVQGLATARVLKLSSLLYSFSVGAGLLWFPWFVTAVYGDRYAGAVSLTLLLLVPTAFENWVRGVCSPALLRNGRGRDLVKLNSLQAVATLLALALVYRQPLETALLVVGSTRAAVASLNLLLLRRALPAQSCLVPLLGAAVGLLSCAAAYPWGVLLPLPAVVRGVVQSAVFAALFYAGLRWLIFRDEDLLRLAHRLTGQRSRLLARLLPPDPLFNA